MIPHHNHFTDPRISVSNSSNSGRMSECQIVHFVLYPQGLKVSQTSIIQLVKEKKQSEAEMASLRQFIPPAYLVTQPMPRARDR